MGKKIGLAVLLAALSSTAFAKHSCKPGHDCDDPKPVAAPEIDPASAMTGLTLALGALLVLRGRRNENLRG